MFFRRLKHAESVNDTIIVVNEVSVEDYASIVECFLDLQRSRDVHNKTDTLFEVRSTDASLPGSLIFNWGKKLYVKDVYVMDTPHPWTFILDNLILDRDRRSIPEETQRWKLTSRMIFHVLNRIDELKKSKPLEKSLF